MKKLLTILLTVLLSLGLVACGNSNTSTSSNVEGTLPEIMEKLYAGIGADNLPMLMQMEVNEENFAFVLGVEEFTLEGYKEALVSEPMIGSIAHSVILVRMEDGADVEAAKTTLLENINPRKWVCVGVEKDQVIVDSIGDLIMVVVVEDTNTAEAIKANFESLK